MPLEVANFIPDLNVSNPAHTDGLSQADSHMRLIKATLKNTFPNFTDVALASTQAQLDAAVGLTTGAVALPFKAGTAALPGLYALGDTGTGLFHPAAGQLGISINGVQVALMSSTTLVTTMSIASTGAIGAAAITNTGAYSGGTGQLVPIGGVLEWYDDVLPPEGGYCWLNGQIIASANTVCPVLLARWGSRYGGNGVTTMGVPDRRDTVGIGKSTMGGVASRGLQTLGNTVLGTLIGVANIVLGVLNLPPYTPSGSVTSTTTTFAGQSTGFQSSGSSQAEVANGTGNQANNLTNMVTATTVSTFAGNPEGGTSTPVSIVQPSTTCNYILRLG